eukprot:m.1481494 g.1481494  ORF g.1481494 m.1481494 type:complete len:743 (-) comp25177_c1_seq6:3865-6093(-)
MENYAKKTELESFVHQWKKEIHERKIGDAENDRGTTTSSVSSNEIERSWSPDATSIFPCEADVLQQDLQPQANRDTKPLLELALGSRAAEGTSVSKDAGTSSSESCTRKHPIAHGTELQPRQKLKCVEHAPRQKRADFEAESKLDLSDGFFDVGNDESDDDSSDFVSLLIRDINDINDVPLFEYTLPIEVATNILSYLDVKSLCRCAQTNKTWNLIANDDALWLRLAQGHGYATVSHPDATAHQQLTVTTFEKRASQSWKEYFVRRYLHEREIHRRWREMIAVFVQLRRPSRHLRRGHPMQDITSATYVRGHGILAAGLGNSRVLVWDLDRPCQELEKKYISLKQEDIARDEETNLLDASSGNQHAQSPTLDRTHRGPAVSVNANACVAAAITAPGPRTRELHVWHLSKHGGTQVFASDIPVECPRLDASCPLMAVADSPTVLWGCGSSVHCYSADSSSTWELHWSWKGSQPDEITDLGMVRAASGIENKGIFAHLSARTVGLHHVANGEVAEYLYGNDDGTVGTTCSCLFIGPEHVAYAVRDAAVGNSLRVHCSHTGRQSAAVDLGNGRVLAVTAVPREPHVYVISTTHGLHVYDTRTDTGGQRVQRHGAVLWSVCADEWKIVCGGSGAAGGGFTGVWDRRTSKRLWYVNDVVPIVAVAVHKEERLVTASVPSHAPYVEPVVVDEYRAADASVNVIDFGAPLSQLVDAECPFSSMFDSVTGYRYNDLLANPYDNVNPYAFQ